MIRLRASFFDSLKSKMIRLRVNQFETVHNATREVIAIIYVYSDFHSPWHLVNKISNVSFYRIYCIFYYYYHALNYYLVIINEFKANINEYIEMLMISQSLTSRTR